MEFKGATVYRTVRVASISVYYDADKDYVAVNVDTPQPLTTNEERVRVVKLIERAVEKMKDKVAWKHATEIKQQVSPGNK